MESFSRRGEERLSRIEDDLLKLRWNPRFQLSHDEEDNVCDLVLSGGGAKGVAHLGALWALDQLDIKYKRLAGNSAGAILAALVAAGYDIYEIVEELFNLDFMEFRDGNWDKRLPRLALIVAVSMSYGMYEGYKLQVWVEKMLSERNASTFGKLPRNGVGMLAPLNNRDGPRLEILASDITHATELRMPEDLKLDRYGRLRPHSFPVAAAVRMSVSVPFFFQPYKLNNAMIVDGAFAANLPLEIFDRDNVKKVRWPTLGINLTSSPSPSHDTKDLFHFGLAIFDTMRHGQSSMSLMNYPTRKSRLVDIPTGDIKTLDFGITKAKKEMLFIHGAREVLETLNGKKGKGLRKVWNFNRYLKLRKRWSFPGPDEDYFDEGLE